MKVIEIQKCAECPHKHRYHSICTNVNKDLEPGVDEIPKWCPLKDAKDAVLIRALQAVVANWKRDAIDLEDCGSNSNCLIACSLQTCAREIALTLEGYALCQQ